jgi:hypothetical protein
MCQIDMVLMFECASVFNQGIGAWDVSNVVHMKKMFYGADTFHQDLTSWNVSVVIHKEDIFGVDSVQQIDLLPSAWRR